MVILKNPCYEPATRRPIGKQACSTGSQNFSTPDELDAENRKSLSDQTKDD